MENCTFMTAINNNRAFVANDLLFFFIIQIHCYSSSSYHISRQSDVELFTCILCDALSKQVMMMTDTFSTIIQKFIIHTFIRNIIRSLTYTTQHFINKSFLTFLLINDLTTTWQPPRSSAFIEQHTLISAEQMYTLADK